MKMFRLFACMCDNLWYRVFWCGCCLSPGIISTELFVQISGKFWTVDSIAGMVVEFVCVLLRQCVSFFA